MTKRKKRLWITSISVLCLCAILFSVFWFVPYRRHWTFRKTPIETDVFLPEPDEIICIIDGEKVWLDEEQIATVHTQLLETVPLAMGKEYYHDGGSLTHLKRSDNFDYTCLELRYKQRHTFVGNEYYSGFQFDAVFLSLHGYFLVVIPYLGISYRTMPDYTGTMGMMFASMETEDTQAKTAIKAFEQTVREMK